jgi:hypothetical protein
VGIRERLRRLEEQAEDEMIIIPQQDGTVARFPQSAEMDALLALIDGCDHPLAEAARNSSEPKWQASFDNAFPIDKSKVPGLSE